MISPPSYCDKIFYGSQQRRSSSFFLCAGPQRSAPHALLEDVFGFLGGQAAVHTAPVLLLVTALFHFLLSNIVQLQKMTQVSYHSSTPHMRIFRPVHKQIWQPTNIINLEPPARWTQERFSFPPHVNGK